MNHNHNEIHNHDQEIEVIRPCRTTANSARLNTALTRLEILLLVTIALSGFILVKVFVGSGRTAAAAPAATVNRVTDHVQDIKEFELKRSLSGVESLIKELRAKGADISQLEANKKDLERKLVSFKSG